MKDADWLNRLKKPRAYICGLQETHYRPNDTVRVWNKVFHANRNQKKQAEIATLISDKTDFKIKTRDKGDYIKIKASIQEDTTTKNIHTTNIGAPRYIRQMLRAIKGEIENNTIIVGDVNTPLASTDR